MKISTLALAATICSHATAQNWDFALLPSSTSQQSLTLSYPLNGTFIGDYDATTNPNGTLTIPGLFGGSGNNAISYSSTLRMGDTIDSHPSGSFSLEVRAGGICEVSSFAASLINGTPGEIGLEMDITYSNFHTVAPSAIFPSVGMVTIPVATGTVKVATAVQNGSAIGALVETAPGSFTVAVAVPVMVTASGSAGGQAFGAQPTPAVMAFSGTLTIAGATATFQASGASTETVGPLPAPPPIVSQPLPLPTVLPPGSTANLLLSGTFGEGSGSSVLDFSIVAAGVPAPVAGDLNGDGIVNGTDLTILLSAWGTANAQADVNDDGTVNGSDLTFLLSNWTR